IGIDAIKNKWAKSSIMTITNIPMMNPDIVTGISMMLLFVFVGSLINKQDTLGFPTLLIAHITFNLPYVILSVMPRLRQLDKHLTEAAQDLGCTQFQSLFKVVIPNIMPSIITGLIMAFTLSLDDFVISYFTNGPSFVTLPVYIYSMTKKRVKPDMYALSTLMFIVILVLLIIYNISLNRSENEQNKRKKEKN
ncbi:MAG: ABC transporter permease, partial [Clostridiales bacterium]|nr:ABC transporter permease [Clostridiales bacterium]